MFECSGFDGLLPVDQEWISVLMSTRRPVRMRTNMSACQGRIRLLTERRPKPDSYECGQMDCQNVTSIEVVRCRVQCVRSFIAAAKNFCVE